MNGNPRIVLMIAIPTLIDTVRRIEIFPFFVNCTLENADKLGDILTIRQNMPSPAQIIVDGAKRQSLVDPSVFALHVMRARVVPAAKARGGASSS